MLVDLRGHLRRRTGAPHPHGLPHRGLHQPNPQHPRCGAADLPQPVPDRRRGEGFVVEGPLGDGDALRFGLGLLRLTGLPRVGDHAGDEEAGAVVGVDGEGVEAVEVVGLSGGLHGGGDLLALHGLNVGPRCDGGVHGVVPGLVHLREVDAGGEFQFGGLPAQRAISRGRHWLRAHSARHEDRYRQVRFERLTDHGHGRVAALAGLDLDTDR
jgi:hypothetical protein